MRTQFRNPSMFEDSINCSYSPLSTFDRTLPKTSINQQELKQIKCQADMILNNIEQQILKCQKLKLRNASTNNNTFIHKTDNIPSYTTNYQKALQHQQIRPNTATRTNITTPLQQRPIQRPLTSKTQEIVVKKNLDLNTLCNADVQMGNFKLDQILGTGSYATVRLAIDKQTKMKFAIKLYDKSKLNDPQRMNNVKREISLLKRLDHPNIIKMLFAIEDKKSINLVMEYISSTSLGQYTKTKPNRVLSIKEGIHIFHQLVKAIKYLHDKNIAHRDIKSENILLMKDTNGVKLIDFGFSICVPVGQKINIFCGTPSYMSPEIVSKTAHSPLTSDIWSLGILFSKILTGEFPFRGTNDRDLYRKIQLSKWKAPDNMPLNEDVSRVIRGCLEKNINVRWDINQLLNDPIFHE